MSKYDDWSNGDIQREIETRKGWLKTHKTNPPLWVLWINSSWDLVEEMRAVDETEVYISLNNGENGVSITVYHANWNGEDKTTLTELAHGLADAAPRAISEAWLQWDDHMKEVANG